ncbi:MAG: hypothetical protein JNK02_03610 [Planctomycetes bacterium]|nr:hypothetical protein [Planctomycetota bacterium]
MQISIGSLTILAALAATAAAQHKDEPTIAKGNPPGHYGPPPGTSFVVLVGGSDDCANAAVNDAITGTGTFAVNTVGATTGVAPQPVGFATIKNDVWFYWTAPTTGAARLETCGGVTVDTKAAAWAANNGTLCPSGTQLAYNDDACSLQTRITWPVTAGQSYFLQLGAFSEGVTYTGTFTLQVLVPPTNDACATPLAVIGDGPHSFDTTLCTTGTEGQSETLCGANTAIARDLWFEWTATVSGPISVVTVGTTTLDTKVAVYPSGGCPAVGSALACNDDYGTSPQSVAAFTATAGVTYLIQLGQDPTNTAAGGTGTFRMVDTSPPAHDNCATPMIISGAGPFPFDTTFATTGTEGQGVAGCGPNTTFTKDLWYRWTATQNGTVVVTNCGQFTTTTTDTKIAVYDGAGCPTAAPLVCNDDAGSANCSTQTLASYAVFTAVCGNTYTIHLGNYSTALTTNTAGTFTVTESGTPCGPPATPFCFGDGTGAACPCGNSGTAGNGCASSVNANGANLTTSGSATISGDTLALLGSGMPNSSALYFQGTGTLGGGLGVAFGDGLRCAGGSIIRLGTKNNVAGASQYPVLGDLSVSVRGLNSAGDFRVYQVWYRNAAAFCTPSTFNLSNGVSLTWAP